MATKLIRLADGILVEVEAPLDAIQQVAGGAAERVNATVAKLKPILINVCEAIDAAWSEITNKVQIESAEVEVGLSFEGEGNVYITKAKASANLVVKMKLRPKA